MKKERYQEKFTASYQVGEIQAIYKNKIGKVSDCPKVTVSSQAADILRATCFAPGTIEWRESFAMLCLNRNGRVISWANVSQGGQMGTVVDNKMVLQFALLSNAASIVVCHNHPSGNLQPSEEDLSITKKMAQACKLMDISLLDHIIITEEDFYSFADNGQL